MFRRHLFANFIFFFLVLFLFGCVAHESKINNEIESISQIRIKALGAFVAIKGVVTTPPAAFESSLIDKGFAIQDTTGGIYISSKDRLDLSPGNEVFVTGIVKENHGFLTVFPISVSTIKSNKRNFVQAQNVSTADVSEKTEGEIVNITGIIIEKPINDFTYGFKFNVDDGSGKIKVFVNTQTGIDINVFYFGQKVSITGLSGQFNNEYEVMPRSPDDVQKLTQPCMD